MGRLKKLRKAATEAVLGEIPIVGEAVDRKLHGDRKRARAKSAPAGWVTADAVVEHVEAEKTGLRIGEHDNDYGDEVSETTITYRVTGADGSPLNLPVGPNELVSVEIPAQGSTWRIAYNPSKLDEAVLLDA